MSSRTFPSRPTPRSQSAGRTRDGDDSARVPLPSGPRVTSSQTSRAQNRTPAPRDRMVEARTTPSSTASSSGSSFLDRMKIRGGDTSSQTSLDDNREEREQRGGGWASARNKRPATAEEEEFDEEGGYQDSEPTKQLAGYGYDLWGRVTTAAGNLTVNVSKAWEKGIVGVVDGEETPPGQESRLTKAMKAYHLDRARSPADLPTWLFDEHERGAAPRSWSAPSGASKDEYEDQFLPDAGSRQRSGLRDVYDKAAASSSSISSSSRRVQDGTGASGAANRLKAIREAKRSGMPARTEAPVEAPRQNARLSEERSSDSTASRSLPSRPRVGLPAGPGRARRV